jgi:hypothetical protein
VIAKIVFHVKHSPVEEPAPLLRLPTNSSKLSALMRSTGNSSASWAKDRTLAPAMRTNTSPLRCRDTPRLRSDPPGVRRSPCTVQTVSPWVIRVFGVPVRKLRAMPRRCAPSSSDVFPLPFCPKKMLCCARGASFTLRRLRSVSMLKVCSRGSAALEPHRHHNVERVAAVGLLPAARCCWGRREKLDLLPTKALRARRAGNPR